MSRCSAGSVPPIQAELSAKLELTERELLDVRNERAAEREAGMQQVGMCAKSVHI